MDTGSEADFFESLTPGAPKPGSPLLVIQELLPRYRSEVCAGCRTTEPTPACIGWIGCQRCGVGFHDDCYWRLMASPEEWTAWIAYEQLDLFLCSGCRS